MGVDATLGGSGWVVQSIPPAVYQPTESRPYAIVAGVLRNHNDARGWVAIAASDAAGHANFNIDSVTNDTSGITVNFAGIAAKNVISFLAVPDDTLAKSLFFCGSSVGLASATIQLKRIRQLADYVSWDGSAFASLNSVFTQTGWTGGTATFSHETASTADLGVQAGVTGRDGAYQYQLGSAAGTSTQVKMYDWLGIAQTTGATGMKFYLDRGISTVVENPNNVHTGTFASSNIWVLGVFEV